MVLRVILLYFMLIITALSCSSGSSTENNNISGGGVSFAPPFLTGDIAEHPVREVVTVELNGTSFNIFDFEKTPHNAAKSLNFKVGFNPPSKTASMFEILMPYKEEFPFSTTCFNSIYQGNCVVNMSFKPSCNGTSSVYYRFGADKAPVRTAVFTGEGVGFADNCTETSLEGIKMASKTLGQRIEVGQVIPFSVVADKPIPLGHGYSASGAVNGFYYSYNCFLNGSNECSGQIMFQGKMGMYECFGESKIILKIHADPFFSAKNDPAVLGFTGIGKGHHSIKDKYPCQMITYE